jgi:hypothetical protein
MSALYIGAGLDLDPLKLYKNIKEFHYVDSAPRSGHGYMKRYNGYPSHLYRAKFIENLDNEMSKNNFRLLKILGDIRLYSNNSQKLWYHTNVSIPQDIDKIRGINFHKLIVAGHDPHIDILNLTKNKLTFIGNTNTVYKYCKNEYEHDNQLTKQIHENENIRNIFESFEMFTNEGINKFNKWEEFILFYENYKKH